MGDFGNPIPPDPEDPYPTTNWEEITYLVWLVWQTLVFAITYVWDWLVWLWQIMVLICQKLKRFLLHIWQNYVKAAIIWLYNEVVRVRAWLKRIITPILKRLQKIKLWYDQHILKQQLRLLQFLQTMRRFLGILRLFHVKWAATLDQDLADIQNRIEQQIRIVRGVFNEIINTLAMVLDPTLLIKTNVLGASLLSNVAAVKRIFGYGDNRIMSGNEVTILGLDSTRDFKTTSDAHIKALVTTGPTDDDKTLHTVAMQALADATNTTIEGQQPSLGLFA